MYLSFCYLTNRFKITVIADFAKTDAPSEDKMQTPLRQKREKFSFCERSFFAFSKYASKMQLPTKKQITEVAGIRMLKTLKTIRSFGEKAVTASGISNCDVLKNSRSETIIRLKTKHEEKISKAKNIRSADEASAVIDKNCENDIGSVKNKFSETDTFSNDCGKMP